MSNVNSIISLVSFVITVNHPFEKTLEELCFYQMVRLLCNVISQVREVTSLGQFVVSPLKTKMKNPRILFR